MEVTDENLATLANYLQQTLNPDLNTRRPAEKFLESVEVNQNYAILLLHLIDKETVDLTIRVAAAIAFKNFIKRNWPVEEDGFDRIHASDRLTIKTLIVSLDAAVAEWDNIPQETVVTSIRSMRERMEAVIRARGGNTRF